MSDTKTLLEEMEKEYGANVATQGVSLITTGRIPTGIFAFDLATGGGFPTGRASILYGPESSLKTSLALKAIAMMQKQHPEKKNVFIDVENSYEPYWGAKLGIDNDALIYVRPEFAEQAVDICEAFLHAEDIGIVLIDSLAALITANETESSAEKAVVGGSGLVVSKLYRKATLALSQASKEGRNPTLIAINQIRFKIGVMYGNPETMPGGMAFKFFSSLTVRLHGKDIIDKKLHPVMPAMKHCSGTIQKYKVPINARNFEFDLMLIDEESKGLQKGMSDDWKTVQQYLKKLNLLYKNEKGNAWVLLDKEYKTLKEVQQHVKEDDNLNMKLRTLVFDTVEAQEGVTDGG